jgi:creatinine amidohydrolase
MKTKQTKPDAEPRGFPVMEDLTVLEIQAYLERRHSILMPIGITEQHGYHLPLSTDALMATGLARQAGQRLGMLVAPTFTQCYSGGTLPGTINISPAVMALALGDNLASLAAQGFRNFYLFLCHGGSENLRALQDALQMLLRNNPAFADGLVALLPVWRLCSPGIGWNAALPDHDWHAGWLETSLVMYLAPALVRLDQLELDAEPLRTQLREHPDNYQQAEKIVDDPFVLARLSQRPDMRVGVMGDPRRASAELGRQVNDDIVNNLVARINKIEAGADGRYKKVKFTPAPLMLGDDD